MAKVFICIIASCLMLNYVNGQVSDSLAHPGIYLKDNISIKQFVDSLKAQIIKDTNRFARKDLIHSSLLTTNKFSYSPLFIINKKYRYKLDIVKGTLVMEFVHEFLNPEYINIVWVVSGELGIGLEGERGKNGIIMVDIKKKRKLNYFVAGIKKRGYRNDNFDQFQQGDIKIHY